jgi:hypothetical protein
MAWLWKQGRPTLLALVGAGVVGYKAFYRGRAPEGQGHAEVGYGMRPRRTRRGRHPRQPHH